MFIYVIYDWDVLMWDGPADNPDQCLRALLAEYNMEDVDQKTDRVRVYQLSDNQYLKLKVWERDPFPRIPEWFLRQIKDVTPHWLKETSRQSLVGDASLEKK